MSLGRHVTDDADPDYLDVNDDTNYDHSICDDDRGDNDEHDNGIDVDDRDDDEIRDDVDEDENDEAIFVHFTSASSWSVQLQAEKRRKRSSVRSQLAPVALPNRKATSKR